MSDDEPEYEVGQLRFSYLLISVLTLRDIESIIEARVEKQAGRKKALTWVCNNLLNIVVNRMF